MCQNTSASICPETGAVIEDPVSLDIMMQKLTGLNEILYHTSSSKERANIIRRAFDTPGRPTHFDRISRKVAAEIDIAMTKVEAMLQEQEEGLSAQLREIESQPEYIEMQRVSPLPRPGTHVPKRLHAETILGLCGRNSVPLQSAPVGSQLTGRAGPGRRRVERGPAPRAG